MEYTFTTKLWQWQGQGAWCFITLPVEYSKEIKRLSTLPRKGFGSERVEVTIGESVWKTSIFPDSKSKSYVLPIKKSVRKSENLELDSDVDLVVKILVD